MHIRFSAAVGSPVPSVFCSPHSILFLTHADSSCETGLFQEFPEEKSFQEPLSKPDVESRSQLKKLQGEHVRVDSFVKFPESQQFVPIGTTTWNVSIVVIAT